MYYLFSILFLIIIFVIIIIIHDINTFKVVEYTVESDKIDSNYKIALLADMHNREFGKDNERLLAAVRDMQPDFICLAGDMLTARPGVSYEPAIKFMKGISKWPVYYGLGNHEYRMKIYEEDYGNSYEEYRSCLESFGINVLENDRLEIPEANINIQGLMIDRMFYKRFEKHVMDGVYIENNVGKLDENRFTIMLAHNPEYFPAYAEYGADLVLSGHVHGGVARLPLIGGIISPKLKLFPRFDGGKFVHGDTTMILSRGLGCHTIPVRFLNPGELVCINLIPCKKQ